MTHYLALAAVSRNGKIGKDNKLPWGKTIPKDMQLFVSMTTKFKNVVMGRRTADSLGGPLPGRGNYVLTRNSEYAREGFTVVHSLEEFQALQLPTVSVIGGAEIYKLFAPVTEVLALTRVEEDFEGDTDFPIEAFSHLVCTEERVVEVSDETPYPLRFQFLELSK